MSREHLFKGKTIKEGKWIYGDLIHSWHKMNTKPTTMIYNTLGKTEVDPTTVCEYTGKQDKNGNKVFEGDIVKTKFGRICRVSSMCCDGYIGFDLDALESEHKMPTEYDLFASHNLEIIGNIFDDKELLN